MNQVLSDDPLDARQSGRHRVFVEGSDRDAIDPLIVQAVLNRCNLRQVTAEPLGTCENVRNAAEAMVKVHQTYYFIIDRDDHDSAKVEKYWRNFPDPDTHNLLTWRKRELENYFIDPAYIKHSQYLTDQNIEKEILKEARDRIFMEAVNIALRTVQKLVRPTFPGNFGDHRPFTTRAAGELVLSRLPEFSATLTEVTDSLKIGNILKTYNDSVDQLSGGKIPLEYGHGNWLEMMSGKAIFHAVSARCFQVIGTGRKVLTGKDQNNQVAKGLLSDPNVPLPSDFDDLAKLIQARVKAPL